MRYVLYTLICTSILLTAVDRGYALEKDDPGYIELKQKIGNIVKGLHQQTEAINKLTERLLLTEKSLATTNIQIRNMEYCNSRNKFYNSKKRLCVDIDGDSSKEDKVKEEKSCFCKSGSFKYKEKYTSSTTRVHTAMYPETTLCGEKWSGGGKIATCTENGWDFK